MYTYALTFNLLIFLKRETKYTVMYSALSQHRIGYVIFLPNLITYEVSNTVQVAIFEVFKFCGLGKWQFCGLYFCDIATYSNHFSYTAKI